MVPPSARSLEEQRREFSQSRFLAMPIAGTIAWSIIGIVSPFVSAELAAWVLFIATGMIFLIGLLIARFIGEDLIGNGKAVIVVIYLITIYFLATRRRPQ